MIPARPYLRRFGLPICLALMASVATAQPGRGGGAGVDREKMWWAPTAEDWKRPVLITWQRTWQNAVKVSRETGKPILVCVNMDGEIASEHYAGVRYRQPEKAKLYEPYVTVIASVYRHNPRDYDEKGQRIICPRFGSVTCGEHIAIEPGLYEKYFEGQRVAPRHIGVELDGKETYDVFYTWDTDSVFTAIRKGITERPEDLTKALRTRAELTFLERVASHDINDQEILETAYIQGDRATRQKLLEAVIASRGSEQIDLLRLAVFGLDVELSRLARIALARTKSNRAVSLINEALRVPMPDSERAALIAALKKIGKSSPRARTLAAVHLGLASYSRLLDLDGWSKALEGAQAPRQIEWSALESRLDYKAQVTKAQPQDATARLELAEASLALAIDPETTRILSTDLKTGPKFARLMFQDAQRAGLKAEKLGASGWRVNAALAIAAYYLGDVKEGHTRAQAAVGKLPSGEKGWNAMGVLGIFSESRMQAITKAVLAKKEWPREWLTDVHAAYSVLSRHPLGTDTQVVAHYDFLEYLGARAQSYRALEAGLDRFPDSGALHDRLRGRTLQEKGVEGLEPAYEAMLEEKDAPKNLEWFAGYASIVAAEFHRRAGDNKKALAAYGRGIAHYERTLETNPDTRWTADHFIAIAIAGRARLAFERKEYENALTELLASFARKPEAAASLDGLNISPAGTARLLRAKLTDLKRTDLLAKLEAALSKLDPSALELPAYERGMRNRRSGNRDPRRRRPRRRRR